MEKSQEVNKFFIPVKRKFIEIAERIIPISLVSKSIPFLPRNFLI